MKLTYPYYYPDFQCIGSQCTDNCCIGWEIDIDTETLKDYHCQPGTFGERIRSSISSGENSHFLLDHQERCPMLNQQNLCDIILNLGKEHLCQICSDHPRFYEWFGDNKEAGLGLCCEEAARLLFSSSNPIELISSEILEEPSKEYFDPQLYEILYSARNTAFKLLQNRALRLTERIVLVLALAEELQDYLDWEQPESCWETLSQFHDQTYITSLLDLLQHASSSEVPKPSQWIDLLTPFQRMEPIDDTWTTIFAGLQQTLPSVVENRKSFLASIEHPWEYEHLAFYFLYRYWMKAVYDKELLSKVKFAAVSLLVVSLLDTQRWMAQHSFRLEDRIFTAKLYSKQVEYCCENLQILTDACWEEDVFQFPSLISLLHCQ